jgi:hypothetical protein
MFFVQQLYIEAFWFLEYRGELPNLDQFFIFLLYTNMKHLIKGGQKKLNYWHQSILGNWFRKLDHRFPTLDRSQRPMKLNLRSKKIVENVKKIKKGRNLTIELQRGSTNKLYIVINW